MTERKRVRVDGYPEPPSRPAPAPTPPAETYSEALEDETCNCPRLEPEEWDGVESDWSDIAFVKTTASALLGVVSGLGGLRNELRGKADKLHVTVPDEPMFLLGSGQFRRPALLEVEDAAPGARGIECPGGIAFTRLVPAPPGKIRPVVRAVEAEAQERYGRSPDQTWLWYLTCRVCSERRNFETLVVAHYREA